MPGSPPSPAAPREHARLSPSVLRAIAVGFPVSNDSGAHFQSREVPPDGEATSEPLLRVKRRRRDVEDEQSIITTRSSNISASAQDSFIGVVKTEAGDFAVRIEYNSVLESYGRYRTAIDAAAISDVVRTTLFDDVPLNLRNAHPNTPAAREMCERARELRAAARRASRKTSKYKGVTLYKTAKETKWGVKLYVEGRTSSFGSFRDEEVAARVFDLVVTLYRGKNEQLNFPNDDPILNCPPEAQHLLNAHHDRNKSV